MIVIVNLHTIMTDTHKCISKKYEDYVDVFLKQKAFKLSSERLRLNMNIQLRPDMTSPYESLYNLSETELTVLCDYLKMNLATEFIQRSISPVRASILFIKKKDDSLHLCVNY